MPEDPPAHPDVRARLDALERRVAVLEAELHRRPAVPPRLPPALAPRPRRTGLPFGVRWAEVNSEDVLGKVGIALLLVGVLFLLKYTLDRELLTPAVRVAGAAAIGGVLLALGLRLRERRRALGRLLTGGGIAALYGSLWTASALYPLLPPVVAFAGLAVVAATALALAVRERDAALSVVGTLGALMTPLLLYRSAGQMGSLVLYTVLVVGGAAYVYRRQGWATLAGAAAAGGWGVMLVAWLVGVQPEAAASGFDRAAFTLGVLAVWAATGLLPALRLARPDPSRTPTLLAPEPLAVLAAPPLAFGFLAAAWAWPGSTVAMLALALGAAHAAAAWRLRASKVLFEPLVLAAAALAAWGVGRWFGVMDGRTIGAVVALACGVVWAARREGLAELRLVGHAAALMSTAALLVHLLVVVGAPWGRLEPLGGGALVRETVAALLAAGALAAIGFTSARGSTARAVYLTAGHLVVLLLVRVLLRPLPLGTALTSSVWAVYAVALVVVGLRLHDEVLRQIGLGTVLATVAKVLLFDLSAIPTLWRVLLFMGLGGLLLLVSYFVPSLLRGPKAAEPVPEPVAPPPRPGDGAV